MNKLLALLLLASACWGQTFRASRPRVFKTGSEWTAIVAKKTGTAAEQAQWAAVTNYVASWCPTSVAVTNYGCLEPMAIAYKVDPVTYGGAYATKACAILKFMVDYDDGNAGGYLDADTDLKNGNQFRFGSPGVALGWDILQPYCDTVDTTVGDKVRHVASRAWYIYKPDSVYPYGRFAILQTPYKVNNNIGIGEVQATMMLAAAAYDPSTYTEPQTWAATIKTAIMDTYLLPCINNSTAASVIEACYGGSFAEGHPEYASETVTRTMDLLDAWRVATTDIDYSAEMDTFSRYMADYLLRAVSPTGPQGTYYKLFQTYYYRDVQAGNGQYYGYLYFMHRQAMLRLNSYFNRVADTAYAAYTQFYLKTIQPVFYMANAPSGQDAQLYGLKLMFEDANSAGTDYRTVPISTDHMTPYMTLSRSDWTENATWIGWLAMQEGGDHMHGDSGSFNIYRKGKWLTREAPGYFDYRSVNPNAVHNTLTVNSHGSGTGAKRFGGAFAGIASMQRRTGGYMSSCNDVFCASQADLSPTYKFTGYQITPDVDTMTRDFFYLKPDIFVVSDRVKYATGVSAPTIFHVQSEKAAAAISSNMATISNSSQRLHVHKVFPSTADFYTPLITTCKIIDVRVRSSDVAAFFFDCGGLTSEVGTLADGKRNLNFTPSEFTGAYAALNSVAMNGWAQQNSSGAEPFSDGNAYSGERLVVTSAGLFAGLPAYDPVSHGYGNTNISRPMQWNDPDINPTAPGLLVTHNPYRLDIHSGRRVNEESFLVVMQGADSTDTPMTVTTLTSTTSNATGAAFTPPGGSLTEIISPTLTTPTYPMCITRTGDPANHYVLGQVPGTTYKVSDSAGVTCIATSGAGSDVVANNAGILNYQVDDSIQSPSITLVATPASLTASCVNGGSNPANQTIDLTVTGDGGEAAVSFSDDSAAISETLSSGSAPQDTPQTMTVAFGGCSGLSVGTHNLTISVTSGTTYVVNSPLTIPVTVTVTANPLIAASPSSVNFTATVSGANPANQTVNISRTVSGDLGSITDDADWLTVTPSSATGITSQDLTLAVDIAGLDPGQHTATITVVSAGASNTPITIPVLLALDNPPVIGLEPRPGTTMIQFRYLAPSRAACTVRACTTAACSSVVASESDGGGHPIRIHTLTGLTAATTYVGQINCSGDIKARQVTTRAATGGPTITLPFNLYNYKNADHILVDYGEDDSFSETPVEIPCVADRCIGSITWSNANRMLWYKFTPRDSMNNVLDPDGKILTKSLIPE